MKTYDSHQDSGGGIPQELRDLDQELSSIEFEERPSFGPELRAELESIPVSVHSRRRIWTRPTQIAAGLALVAAGTVSVPAARASMFDMWTRIQGDVAGPPVPAPVATSFEFLDSAAEDPVFVPLSVGAPEIMEQEPAAQAPWSGDLAAATPIDAYPELLDRDGIDDLVRWFYPDRLESQGVGGVVRLIVWVEDDGSVSDRQVARSSGVPELDEATLQAAQHFRFKPARRRGQPVGTWVEFDVNVQSDGAGAPTG